MTKKFIYGYDANKYIEKAHYILREKYPWFKEEMLEKKVKYTIEKIDGKYKFCSYSIYSDGEEKRYILDCDGEEFISNIVENGSFYVENANPTKDVFKVPFECGTDAHGWHLEMYEFRTHKLGGYSSFVQAGDRCTGGSREFFLPESFFEGTFDEFLDKYIELVPGWAFGLYKEDLQNVDGLKEFLGFTK